MCISFMQIETIKIKLIAGSFLLTSHVPDPDITAFIDLPVSSFGAIFCKEQPSWNKFRRLLSRRFQLHHPLNWLDRYQCAWKKNLLFIQKLQHCFETTRFSKFCLHHLITIINFTSISWKSIYVRKYPTFKKDSTSIFGNSFILPTKLIYPKL